MTSLRLSARLGCILAASALLLSACGDFKETHNPTVSDLTLSPDHMGEVNRISIPMPLPTPADQPKRADQASLWSKQTPRLFQDRRAGDVGDLVTVLIDIDDRAQLQNATGRIRWRVAALVIQTLPNGNFVIAGRQEVKVNNELRELRIAGIIRQSDINVGNTIDYDKIAEARITYGGRGQISTVQTARYGQDALEVFLPY